ncbi:MAG: hypothetical protein WCF82_12575 [Microcoleus sp.]
MLPTWGRCSARSRLESGSAIVLLYICAGMQDSETLFLKVTRFLFVVWAIGYNMLNLVSWHSSLFANKWFQINSH